MALQNAQSIGFFRSLLKVATDTEREGVMQGINPPLYSALTQVLRASKYIKKLNVETAQELIGYITDAEKLQSIKDTDKRVMVGHTVDLQLREIGAVLDERSHRTWTPYNSVVVTAKTKKVLEGKDEDVVIMNLSRMQHRDDKLIAAWIEKMSEGGVIRFLNIMQHNSRMYTEETSRIIGKRLMGLDVRLFNHISPKARVSEDTLEAALEGWDFVVCEKLAHIMSMSPTYITARRLLGSEASDEVRNATVSAEAVAVWRKKLDYGMLLYAKALSEEELRTHIHALESEASYNRMETLKFARRAEDIHLIVEECYRRGWWSHDRTRDRFRWSSNLDGSAWLSVPGLNENTAKSIMTQGSNESVVLYLLGRWGMPSTETINFGAALLYLDDLDSRTSGSALNSWTGTQEYRALVRAIFANSTMAIERVVQNHYTWSDELARATLDVLCETLATDSGKWAMFASLLTNAKEQPIQMIADAANVLA